MDAVLLTVVFVPLFLTFVVALFRMIFDDRKATGAVSIGLVVALWGGWAMLCLVITSMFYGVIQGIMIVTLWAFGQTLPEAGPPAAASLAVAGIGSFAVQCAGKTAEHSLTERVAHLLGRLFSSSKD
jgi:hypothetical protein